MLKEPIFYEVIVIGAGPAGLSTAAECLYHGISSVLVLESGETHNQTIHKYYPDAKRVDARYLGQEANCAGLFCFRDTTKANFLELIEKLIETYRPQIEYRCKVDSIRKMEGGTFEVTAADGRVFRSLFVVLAMGRMGKPNRPEFYSKLTANVLKHVHFDVRKIADGKRVLVVGGGNTAVEFALSLSVRAQVSLSYRQQKFTRLNPMNLSLLESELENAKLTALLNSTVTDINDSEGGLSVKFANGDVKTFDEVVFAIGGSAPTALLSASGVELDARNNPVLTADHETSIAGLYVAGELCVPQGKGSIIVSFNSGFEVVRAITQRLQLGRKPEMVLAFGMHR